MNMAFRYVCMLLSLSLSTNGGLAQTAPFFDLRQDKNFANYRQVVLTYIGSQHLKLRGTVCVVGQQNDDQTRTAWVIWLAAGRIISWDGGRESLADSRRAIDLKRDTVANESDVKGSTYLVTKSWVKELNESCLRHGVRIEVGAAPMNGKQ